MLDAAELIALSRALSRDEGGVEAGETRLRRAVSTAYYALFHMVLRGAADRFVGSEYRTSAAYTVIYRSFDHAHMRDACIRLSPPVLRDKYKELFGKSVLSLETRSFCSAFVQLQRARILADYDPGLSLTSSRALGTIEAAEEAMSNFAQIAPGERTDLLALLMAPART